MKNSSLIAGAAGMKIIDTFDVVNDLRVSYFLPREDTVLTSCTGVDGKGNAVDFMTINNWDGTLKSTDTCAVPRGHKITSIEVSSGSIQIF